jgi:hypothetical protein
LPTNGLTEAWTSNGAATSVFINPPFGTSYIKDGVCISADEFGKLKDEVDVGRLPPETVTGWTRQVAEDWATKVVAEHRLGRQIIWLSKASLETKALQRLLRAATAICHPGKRVNYINAATGQLLKGATFSSVLFYLGDRTDHFKAALDDFGTVLVPVQAVAA